MNLFRNSKFIALKSFIFTAIVLSLVIQGVAVSSEVKDDGIGSAKAATLMFPATSMPDRDWWQVLWPNPKDVVLSLGVKSGMSVVDLCCGYGYFTFPLSEISTRVYGIELEADLLEEAQKEAEAKGIRNCQWIQGDAMNLLSLVPEPVDYVLLANTFHGIPEKEALTRSVASILKPKGQFSIVNWHKIPREETTILGLPRGPKTDMRMSPDQVAEILLPLGFELSEIVELPPYHYGAIFTKLMEESISDFSITETDIEKLRNIERKVSSEFHILCLCAGNATRSQLAEGWLKHLSDNSIKVMSAATADSRPINSKAIQVMEEAGITIINPISKKLTMDMIEWADLVITTCSPSDENCPVLPRGTAKLHWLIETSAKKSIDEEELLFQTRSMSETVQRHALVLLDLLKDIHHI